MTGAQVAIIFVQARLGTGASTAGLWTCPNGEYASREAPVSVAMAAKQSIETSKEGRHHCRQSSAIVHGSYTADLTDLLIDNVLSCCLSWRWGAPTKWRNANQESWQVPVTMAQTIATRQW